jgi:hypothetical protein
MVWRRAVDRYDDEEVDFSGASPDARMWRLIAFSIARNVAVLAAYITHRV